MSDRTITIDGITVTVKQPYEEGHPISALEAEKLNGLLVDSIRTSLSSKLKRHKESDNFDASGVAAEFQAYADSYAFSVRSTKTRLDPVEREAHKIAKEQINAAIRQRGANPAQYSADEINGFVARVMQKKGEEIRAEARRRIEDAQKISADGLDAIFSDAA